MAAVKDWSRVCAAFEVLGVDQREEEVFWLVLAAITNLGVLATKIGEYLYTLIVSQTKVMSFETENHWKTNLFYFYTSKDLIFDIKYKLVS